MGIFLTVVCIQMDIPLRERDVDVMFIKSFLYFFGEFELKSEVILWLDPDTKCEVNRAISKLFYDDLWFGILECFWFFFDDVEHHFSRLVYIIAIPDPKCEIQSSFF